MRAQLGGRAQVRRDVRRWGEQRRLEKGREALPSAIGIVLPRRGRSRPGYRTTLDLNDICFKSRTDSTVITFVVVIVIIPIPLRVPAVVIFTPPTMAVVPATLAGFA